MGRDPTARFGKDITSGKETQDKGIERVGQRSLMEQAQEYLQEYLGLCQAKYPKEAVEKAAAPILR